MKNLKPDTNGIGGKGVLLILILLIIIGFLGGGIVQPMIMKQDLTAGDYLTYRVESSNSEDVLEITYMFKTISTTSAELEITLDDLTYTGTVDIAYDGNTLVISNGTDVAYILNVMEIVEEEELQKSTSVKLVGYLPMLVDVYTDSDGSSITTKMGTNIPVEIVIPISDGVFKITLIDSSITWINYFWALI